MVIKKVPLSILSLYTRNACVRARGRVNYNKNETQNKNDKKIENF